MKYASKELVNARLWDRWKVKSDRKFENSKGEEIMGINDRGDLAGVCLCDYVCASITGRIIIKWTVLLSFADPFFSSVEQEMLYFEDSLHISFPYNIS